MWDDTALHARVFTTWKLFHVVVWNLGDFSDVEITDVVRFYETKKKSCKIHLLYV